jgi:hypothetical protein
MDKLDTELMALTVLSVLLCWLALSYNEQFVTGVFAALTCGALVGATVL